MSEETTVEQMAARYNADTPLNIINTCLFASAFILRNERLVDMATTVEVMNKTADLVTAILTKKVKVTERGIESNAEGIASIIPDRVH